MKSRRDPRENRLPGAADFHQHLQSTSNPPRQVTVARRPPSPFRARNENPRHRSGLNPCPSRAAIAPPAARSAKCAFSCFSPCPQRLRVAMRARCLSWTKKNPVACPQPRTSSSRPHRGSSSVAAESREPCRACRIPACRRNYRCVHRDCNARAARRRPRADSWLRG